MRNRSSLQWVSARTIRTRPPSKPPPPSRWCCGLVRGHPPGGLCPGPPPLGTPRHRQATPPGG
eukprot:202997-Pyramimonas_sp.AAC.1